MLALLLWTPVNLTGVLRGQILRARGVLGPEAKPICAPKRLFAYFLFAQKVGRLPGETGKVTRLSGRNPTTFVRRCENRRP